MPCFTLARLQAAPAPVTPQVQAGEAAFSQEQGHLQRTAAEHGRKAEQVGWHGVQGVAMLLCQTWALWPVWVKCICWGAGAAGPAAEPRGGPVKAKVKLRQNTTARREMLTKPLLTLTATPRRGLMHSCY